MRNQLTYGQADNADIFSYRDREGLEADAIIQAEDGQWAAIEIKLGHNQANKAAANLLKVRDKIVNAGGKNLRFLPLLRGEGLPMCVKMESMLSLFVR